MPQDTIDTHDVSGVYVILHTSGRAYVGESLNIRIRWKGHIETLNNNAHNNKFLQRVWNKYGRDSFEFKLIAVIKLDPELTFVQKKRILKREENKISKLYPKLLNLETPGKEYLTAGKITKKKLSSTAIRNTSTPEGKARMKRIKLQSLKDPVIVERHKQSTKRAWQDHKVKASRIAAYNTSEGKKNRAKAAAEGWKKRKDKLQNDPEFLEKHQKSRAIANKKLKELYNTEERKKMLSEQSFKSWQIGDRKEKVSNSLKEFYNDPQRKEIFKNRIQELWKDPEYKARVLATRKRNKKNNLERNTGIEPV